MKRCSLVLLAVLMLAATLRAQQEEQFDEPVPPRRSAPAKIGFAGGFVFSGLFLNLDPLNEVLRSSGAAPLDNSTMLMPGGTGYAYILLVQNVRLGGIGQGGSMRSSSLSGSVRRDVDLSIAYGGVSIEYVIPVRSRLDVAVGVTLGSLGMTLKVTKDDGTAKVWDDLWGEYSGSQPVANYTRSLSGGFFSYQPSVTVEYAILRWLGVRVGASYNGLAGASWTLDDTHDVFNVPSGINARGFMVNAGLFVGTFVY
jgi:hypothetical protein